MAMVVMGGMCVQIITTIHTTISNLYAAMLLYRLRLFVVGGEHNIEMAMVVVGHICTQNIMITQHYLL